MTKLGTDQAKSAAAENNNWHQTVQNKKTNIRKYITLV